MKQKNIVNIISKMKNLLRHDVEFREYYDNKLFSNSLINNTNMVNKGYIYSHKKFPEIKEIKNNVSKEKINDKLNYPQKIDEFFLEDAINNNSISRNSNALIRLPKINKICSTINNNNNKNKNNKDLFYKKYSSNYSKLRYKNKSMENIFEKNKKDNINKNNFLTKSALNIFDSENQEIKFFIKDFFDINPDSNYIYDENEIFNKKDYYYNYINKLILNLKESGKNDNLTSFLQKEINYQKKENKFLIEITSLKIKFINKNEKFPLYFEFLIPFNLLPIFYSKNLNIINIIELISNFAFFKDENFNNMNLFDEKIFGYLYTNPNLNNKENININLNKNLISFDKIIFPWITPKYIFNVIIESPRIYFKYLNKNIQFIKILDFELLFYLLEKNFVFWDFYIFNYLFNLKKFRIILKKCLSYINDEKCKNLIVNLDHKIRVLNYEDYNYNEYILIKTNKLFFNSIIKIKSSIIKIKFNLLNNQNKTYEKEKIIYFNFKQTKILYELYYQLNNDFNNFFKKFINIKFINNNKSYKFFFDFEKFNNFNINEFFNYYNLDTKNTEQINKKNDHLSPIKTISFENKNINDFNFVINFPIIEKYNIGNLNMKEKILYSKENGYKLYNKINIENWPKYLINNIIPESYKLKNEIKLTKETENNIEESKNIIQEENINIKKIKKIKKKIIFSFK